MSSIIEVNDVKKFYRLGQISSGTMKDDLSRWWSRMRGEEDPLLKIGEQSVADNKTHWALKGVSFKVKPGEVLGIIGKNGAGKSTLLKILSRVTAPTAGEIKIHGRIASLLEVGTGFHPDLSGRENVYQNGAILGMKRSEIKSKFDEIVEFSGVERFIDTPVKRYSSGMYVRLAFAVAAHLEPEILIVDEVLAVGDADFQKKCLGKMKAVSAGEGRTVLFVSHNMQAVKNLCNKSLYLVDGRLQSIGDTEKVINDYLLREAKKVSEVSYETPDEAPGIAQVKLKSAKLEIAGRDKDYIDVHTPFKLKFEFWNFMKNEEINLSMVLFDIKGECIFNIGTKAIHAHGNLICGEAKIPPDLLNDGNYYISIVIVKDKSTPVYYFEELLHFEVTDERGDVMWYGKWPGAVRPTFIEFNIETRS
jgi:lipopolysaccharide transport system ATP-binding protein